MIHVGNGRKTLAIPKKGGPQNVSPPSQKSDQENKVTTWIKQNPVLGLSLALVAGLGAGLLIKRMRK